MYFGIFRKKKRTDGNSEEADYYPEDENEFDDLGDTEDSLDSQTWDEDDE